LNGQVKTDHVRTFDYTKVYYA